MPEPREAVAITPPFSLHAWVDESVTTTGGNGYGAYVIAGVVADSLAAEPLRDRLGTLVLPGKHRLHWMDERPPRRDQIAQVIAECDLVAWAVVGTPMRNSTQERARGRCLECLLMELQRLGVSQVWLEARTESLNRHDLRLIEDLHGHRLLSRAMRVNLRRPLDEPMLWLPDVVAGAVTAARHGQPRWLRMLGPMVTLVEISVR